MRVWGHRAVSRGGGPYSALDDRAVGGAATVLVEPDPGGHRFQAVANVARVAARTGPVVLLTSDVGATDDAFGAFLSEEVLTEVRLDVRVVFDSIRPPTSAMTAAVAEVCRSLPVSTTVVMDADQSLKRWWWEAPRAFRGLARRPRVVFMLTRYPAKLGLRDAFGWKLRLAKGGLAILARANGSVHRVVGFAGRDDLSRGWLVKRVRDPAVCLAHSRDRERLRRETGLPLDRRLAGVFGAIEQRKNIPMVLEALELEGLDDVDILVGGGFQPEVWDWINALPPERRRRILARDGFWSDLELDTLVACVDACPIALTNNGPSGIMGKAWAAGVPVVTAGSEVRAREIRATGAGLATDLDPASLGRAIRRVLDGDHASSSARVPPATPDEFARTLLGI